MKAKQQVISFSLWQRYSLLWRLLGKLCLIRKAKFHQRWREQLASQPPSPKEKSERLGSLIVFLPERVAVTQATESDGVRRRMPISLLVLSLLCENQLAGIGSRRRRIKPITIPENQHCDWLVPSASAPDSDELVFIGS